MSIIPLLFQSHETFFSLKKNYCIDTTSGSWKSRGKVFLWRSDNNESLLRPFTWGQRSAVTPWGSMRKQKGGTQSAMENNMDEKKCGTTGGQRRLQPPAHPRPTGPTARHTAERRHPGCTGTPRRARTPATRCRSSRSSSPKGLGACKILNGPAQKGAVLPGLFV